MDKSQATRVRSNSRQATYQDELDAPPHMVAEIVEGALYTNPRPAILHTMASSGFESLIGPSFHFGN